MSLRLALPLSFFLIIAAAARPLAAAEGWTRVSASGELRWGADATGGAPYIFPDPKNPAMFAGFEVDLMGALASRLGLKAQFVQIPWDQLVPALGRNDCDIVFNGLEVTSDRQKVINFSDPYYYFSQQITVRKNEWRWKTLTQLRGHRVGTLGASLAEHMLKEHGGIEIVSYPSPVEMYKDLEFGRTDAALLDVPIASWYAGPNPNLENVGEPIGLGMYAAGVRKDSPLLLKKINWAIADLTRAGELKKIYKKWNIWTKEQSRLKSKATRDLTGPPERTSILMYIPILLRGAKATLMISLISMALAVALGLGLCLGKLYGPAWLRLTCSGYIEVVRGTPVLIQLFILYYGLPNVGIELTAFTAAVLGMGFNYAAYEAEIYRAGILSVARGQDEAARSLGLSGSQTLWYIILPQAFRTILPPSTNDFIALLKDTSIVSIVTVTELTRAYTHAATVTYRFLELGLITAALYFIMSYPLALWSRRIEAQRHAAIY